MHSHTWTSMVFVKYGLVPSISIWTVFFPSLQSLTTYIVNLWNDCWNDVVPFGLVMYTLPSFLHADDLDHKILLLFAYFRLNATRYRMLFCHVRSNKASLTEKKRNQLEQHTTVNGSECWIPLKLISICFSFIYFVSKCRDLVHIIRCKWKICYIELLSWVKREMRRKRQRTMALFNSHKKTRE